MAERTERRADFIESICSLIRLLFARPREQQFAAPYDGFEESDQQEGYGENRYVNSPDASYDDNLDELLSKRVSEMLHSTRRLTSALRSAERGWDWNVVHSSSGESYLDVVHVSSDESQREANQLLLELLELQETTRTERL